MHLQLDMFTPYYYSTLGFDCELIDYLNFIDDSFVRELFPDYQKHTTGRNPIDPVTLFRMHYLYFIKDEFSTFRQMCRELKKPKHQDYRNFIGIYTIKDVPSHAALSRFRTQLEISEKCVEEIKSKTKDITCFTSGVDKINAEIVQQACKEEGFLNLMLGSIDSRPLKAKIGFFKAGTHDSESNEGNEGAPKSSDKDATVGRQRTKVNQNRYFIGYRKNTVIVDSSQGPVPITSVLVNASTSDQNITIPAIKQVEKMGIEIPVIVGDMGYMNDDSKLEAIEKHNVIFHTEVKKNMQEPEYCNENGQLECPEGAVMSILDYDLDRLEVIAGVENTAICKNCFRYSVCESEFVLSMKENPHFYNIIPQKSELQEKLINYRKQSELNFALESNRLASICRHNKLPIRNLAKVDVFMRLSDIFQMAKKLIQHCQQKYRNSEYFKSLSEMAEKIIYERAYCISELKAG